jgi:hypothetical protein
MTVAVVSRPIAVLLALLVVLSFCRQARAQNDHLIVPWERIGPIALGMSAADLNRILGEPTQTLRGPFVSVYNWKNNLSVFIKTDGSYVTQICALNPSYATAQGVHPGSTDLAVTALLGPPQNARLHTRWSLLSYTDLFWPGLMVSVPLTGFDTNHSVRTVCVNHNA